MTPEGLKLSMSMVSTVYNFDCIPCLKTRVSPITSTSLTSFQWSYRRMEEVKWKVFKFTKEICTQMQKRLEKQYQNFGNRLLSKKKLGFTWNILGRGAWPTLQWHRRQQALPATHSPRFRHAVFAICQSNVTVEDQDSQPNARQASRLAFALTRRYATARPGLYNV